MYKDRGHKMVRRITQKKRGIKTRKEKKLFILGLEGKNETEKNYFMSFNPILKKSKNPMQCEQYHRPSRSGK